MPHKDKLAGGQRPGLGGKAAVHALKHGVIAVVKGKPAAGAGHHVHNVPPVRPAAPEDLQRHKTIKRRVQNAADNAAQVAALQILRKAAVEVLGLRGCRFAVRRPGPEGKVWAVEHPVFAAQYGRGDLIVGGQLRQYGGIVPASA